ncbi:methyl-CpG-binding domain-containing protein 11 [Amborella trichopoda]|nr:methyl-CpG-binding domain-containing protein 11 [Amborella trichopoda]|eukprot:XP_006847662.2 methyl-CpG-binding domain-containing protein 11 [Amborella trichopoda]
MASPVVSEGGSKVEEHHQGAGQELRAPPGWKKKILAKNPGMPSPMEVVFISPSGSEIKNKRQLFAYLKSNPGGAAAADFDWSTGGTRRRSARLSEKLVLETPESESKNTAKRARKSHGSSAKSKENDDKSSQGSAEKEFQEGSLVHSGGEGEHPELDIPSPAKPETTKMRKDNDGVEQKKEGEKEKQEVDLNQGMELEEDTESVTSAQVDKKPLEEAATADIKETPEDDKVERKFLEICEKEKECKGEEPKAQEKTSLYQNSEAPKPPELLGVSS